MNPRLSPDTTHRRCARCGETKILAAFGRSKGKTLGRAYACRVCKQAYDKAYREGRPMRFVRGPSVVEQIDVPLPAMDLLQKLECVRFNKWRYPVSGQLVGWRL